MKKPLFIFSMIATMITQAQDGTVSGTVSDAETKEAMVGVGISFATGRNTSTDLDGAFTATLPAGDYTVLFRSVGYEDQTLPLHIDAGGTTLLTVGMKASASQLEQVVVTAGRFEQRVGEVTQSLSILPPNIVRDKNNVSLEYAMDQVPGVVLVDNDPQIRAGSGFSYGAGSRVMMLVDDLPILSGDIGRPSWSFLPIENLEQVEVIKGASSVLYGSAALSGVINVRTAYPRSEPRTRVTTYGGVYTAPGHGPAKWWGDDPPSFTGTSFLHSRQIGAFDLVLGGMAYNDHGYVGQERLPADTLAVDPQRIGPGGYENRVRFNIATRWRNQKWKGLSYGINGNVMRSNSTSIFIWDDIESGLYRPEPSTVTKTKGTQYYIDPFVTLIGKHGTRQNLRGRYYFQDFNNSGDQSNSSRMLYVDYQVQQKFELFGETRVTAGVAFQRTNSDAVLYRGNADGDSRNTAGTTGFYLQLDKKLFKNKLAINGGVRYETFTVNDYEKSQPVFRAGATYQVLKGTFVRASYGQGFRFPTIGERYIRTNVGQLNIYPNPDLEPETSYNLEGGVKQGFRIGGFEGYIDGVYFQQEYDRYVEFTFGQWAQPTLANFFGLGFRSVNTGGARITGYEFELAGKGRIGNVEVTALLGYTHTLPVSTTPHEVYAQPVTSLPQPPIDYIHTSYDTTDNILKFRVQDLFRSDVGLSYKWVFGGVSVRYNSHVRNLDKIFVDLDENGLIPTGAGEWMKTHTTGDWIVDARLGVKLSKNVKASIIVNNLTNEVYAIRPLAIEAPRSVQVQMVYEL
jgi:outer membrane receptor protein involved in Fe transport